eukprot:CAMPEP_0118927694 /NCGR_PEP_ID=MMETSP1169-20130426/5116_1 /TAXON_ID=36882 /ORGANISM="Pyramimonas obovata, Strain CCMP722" /LENGTH=108 /DNA_ID=CAMNT_0006869517 /DNA_START=319 /DNA_END=645 /DNA_ORIENTATION=-
MPRDERLRTIDGTVAVMIGVSAAGMQRRKQPGSCRAVRLRELSPTRGSWGARPRDRSREKDHRAPQPTPARLAPGDPLADPLADPACPATQPKQACRVADKAAHGSTQ